MNSTNIDNYKKRLMYSAVIALLLFPAIAAAEIYKCKDTKGAVTFQQAPCTGEGDTPLRIRDNHGFRAATDSEMEAAADLEVSKLVQLSDVSVIGKDGIGKKTNLRPCGGNVHARKSIASGMSEGVVFSIMGRPGRESIEYLNPPRGDLNQFPVRQYIYLPCAEDSAVTTIHTYGGAVVKVKREISRY